MCYTRRGEDIEYEALRLAEMQAREKEQKKTDNNDKQEKKPLVEKVKEMVGAR
jgi:hypothetical protein